MSFSKSISGSTKSQDGADEDGLQNNDQLLKAVFNITAIGIVVVDEGGYLVEVNERTCKMFGYNRNELIGKSHTILHVEDEKQAAIKAHVAFFGAHDKEGESEWKGVTKNNEEIIIAYSANLLVQDNGQRFKVKSIRDITNERKTEQLLEASQKKYKSIFENSLQAFFLTKPDGTILEANKAACKIFGYTQEELCQLGRRAIIDHTDMRLSEKLHERSITGTTSGELTGIRKNGQHFPIEFSSYIFIDSNGEERTSTVLTDISERKEQEMKLRESKEEMASILNNTEEIFMIIDREYRLLNYNKAAEERSAELLAMPLNRGESLLKWADPERYQMLKTIYDRVLSGETIRYKHTISKNGETATLQIAYLPVVSDDGLCDRFMVSVREITVEENALNAIISKQELLTQAEAIAHVGSWELDLTTNTLHWSDEVFRICGYQPGAFEVTLENGLGVIHPDDRASSVAEMQQAIEEKRDYAASKRFVRPDGSIRYIVSKAKIILNSEGSAVRLVGVFHDITDLKEVERELAISQQEYKTLFEQHPDAVVSFDLTGKFTSVNDAALELAEASREQLLKSDFVQYIDVDKTDDIVNYLLQVVNGKTQRFETVIITSTNVRKSVNVILMPIYIQQEITGVYGVLKDITIENLYEEELEFQSHLLNTIQQSVIVTKLDGTIIFWNRFAEKLYGWEKEDVIGINIMDVIPTEMSIEQGAEVMEWLAKGESWSGEFLVKHKTTGPFTAQIHNSPVIDAHGKLTGIIGVSWDITERKQYEQQKEFDRLDKEALINTTTDLIWSVSSDYKLIAANKAFLETLKLSDDLILKPGDDVLVTSVFPEEMVAFWRNSYRRALAGESFTIELHTAGKGAFKEHWDEIIFNPITKNEEVIGVACRGRDITQNKNYQRELVTINNQLEMAQQIARLGYWSHDLKNDVLFWSKEVYTIFGLDEKAFNGDFNSFFRQVHPEDQKLFLEEQRRILNGNAPLEHEHRIVLPNGEVKYVIQKGSVIFNDEGKPVLVEGTIQDVTDVKSAALALKVNEEQLNLIYNSTAGIIFLIGVEKENKFRFISMNNAGLTTIGLTADAVFGKYVHEVIPQPSLTLALEKYNEAVVTKQSVVWQEISLYPAGTKVGVVTVTPIFDSEGICIRLVGSVNDITELKNIEQSLAISQQEYKSLFDQNPDAVYSLDRDGNFISFNPGLEKLLECNREELFQKETFVPFCHPDDLEKTIQCFGKVLQGEPQAYNVQAITKNGHNRYLSISNMPIVVNGIITGVYGIAKDITQQKEAELQLKELFTQLEQRASELEVSNRELERFAYIASHDLQEPLRMVSSFLQLLQKKYNNSIDEKGQEYIRFAVDGSVRMKRLINDLLDYSRVTTRKQELEKVDMQQVVNEVMQNLGLQIQEKHATIQVSKMPLLAWADKTQMIQLLQNLVGNALKYSSDEPPLVQINAEEGTHEWLFAVKDNGIGFDQKFAEKIFVIFQRLHNKAEYSGTGIGLAICKKIVDRHGGSIRVESEPGKGSDFYFTISKHLVAEKPDFPYERS